MDPSTEDAKLITLARSARTRINSYEGAAVRDQDGRTYVAANVTLDSLSIDALPLAVAMAISSGARKLEACAVVFQHPDQAVVDLSSIRELSGHGVPVHLADDSGTVFAVHES